MGGGGTLEEEERAQKKKQVLCTFTTKYVHNLPKVLYLVPSAIMIVAAPIYYGLPLYYIYLSRRNARRRCTSSNAASIAGRHIRFIRHSSAARLNPVSFGPDFISRDSTLLEQ
jgi:hypothetical protein